MKNKYAWGRWLALLGIGVAATLLVYLTVDEAQLVKWFSRYGRFLVGAVLVSLIVLAIVLPRRKQVRLDLQLASKERGLEPPKPEGKPEHRESRDARTRAIALRDVLVDRHGWCWRYRDRWVLVAGDTPSSSVSPPNWPRSDTSFSVTRSYCMQTRSATSWTPNGSIESAACDAVARLTPSWR